MPNDESRNYTLPDDKDRLNLQMNRELKIWAKGYAKRTNTTLTGIITQHFLDLKREEEILRGHVDVEQI